MKRFQIQSLTAAQLMQTQTIWFHKKNTLYAIGFVEIVNDNEWKKNKKNTEKANQSNWNLTERLNARNEFID